MQRVGEFLERVVAFVDVHRRSLSGKVSILEYNIDRPQSRFQTLINEMDNCAGVIDTRTLTSFVRTTQSYTAHRSLAPSNPRYDTG